VAIHTIEIEKKETEEKTLKYLELLKELLWLMDSELNNESQRDHFNKNIKEERERLLKEFI
jgi:hypothetical protein